MKLDGFLVGLGIAQVDGELPDAARKLLSDHAEAFLRAGGVFHLHEWNSFSQETRAALVDAGNRIWRERASLVGIACQSEIHALMVNDPEDGKDALARKAVDFMVEKELAESRKLEAQG